MPTADQLFYGSLRASTPIRRGVPSTTTASREDSRRRATTPTATSSEARRVSSLRAHEGPRVVKSTNVTTSAAVSSSQKDNRFSGAAQDQGPQQRARVDMQQRSTPSFSSSHITGHSLDSAAVVDERRHSHRWAKASTTTSGGTPLMSSLSTVRRHPAHSPTRTARTVNGEGMAYDGVDDGAPKLFALEKTLEAEMMELRRLTDSLETTMASVMSLEDQRKTLARMVGRSRTLQTQREAPQQQQQQHQYTNGERRSDQDAMIATPRRAVAPVPISPRQFHEQQLPPSHAVSSEPRTFNWATPSSQHQQRRQQRGDNLTSEVDDQSQVLSFVASAIQLTDSGKKKAATTLQISSPKQMTASSSRRAPRQADVSLADDYDDLLALESSPIVSHVSERIVMRQLSTSSQKKDYHHTPHKVVRDDDDDDDKETVEECLSDDDNDAMMVIDFSSTSPMKKSQRGNHNERRNERDIDAAHTSSSHRRASFVQPNMESANQQGVKTSHHNFSPPQPSNRDTTSTSTLSDPSLMMPTSFSSAALLLGAQAHSLKGDLLKYEEDLLMLQDELIRTQRGGGGDDESEMALLMHLRLVLRDELSTCKKRGQTLESVAEQLILAR